MNQITIKIQDKEYIVKQGFGSLMLFEEMTGKNVFEVNESISDMIKLFYCYLKARNKDTFLFSFDEFVNILDDNQEIFTEFYGYLKSLQPTKEIDSLKKK